ncbi:hypothetical protein [Burkholderia cepacia]|uniref:Uncharacterized protein n=1 Tax=Burkholderia cepacia TaxID=292 RepID=A0AAX2RCT1_BURCE|nr:hypothetical protein [Burkholderia cepacia]TES96173.1 hypothetical protein E3D36_36620 [Burkholderia cepacia]TEU32949.1 hypothetical protein E3D37_42025 [Burkholderia cepacia]TEU36201.1 hypothetical protein E3D38_41160 [Burkholderia cepacia]TEU85094.1 hypothetical protein E3D40_42285 [Burkholderia cepacia]TEU95279.1 hypothetical protein E3D44_42945 [Burkholderia cepacia]
MRKALDGQPIDPVAVEREIERINAAIDGFAAVMKAAMAGKAAEGRTGWDDPSLRATIVGDLIAHAICADKSPGHEVHAANYAMMLHHISTSNPSIA